MHKKATLRLNHAQKGHLTDRCGLVLDTWPCAVQERFALLARQNLSPRTLRRWRVEVFDLLQASVASWGRLLGRVAQRFETACGEEWRRGFAEVPPCGPPHIIMVRRGSDTVRGRRRRGPPTMKTQYNRGGEEVSPANKHAI